MSTDKMEQMFLDGSHPALRRDADAAATLRASSPPRSRSSSPARPSDDDDDGPRFTAIDPDPSKGGEMPTRAPGGGKRGHSRNTGVKGVRADYKEAQRAKQSGNGALNGLAEKVRTKMVVSLDKEEEEDDELAELRRKRLQELQMQGSGERRGSDALGNRVFGHLREVGVEGYVNAVEEEDEDVAVVVHLYERVSLFYISMCDITSCLTPSPAADPNLRAVEHPPRSPRPPLSLNQVHSLRRLRARLHVVRHRRQYPSDCPGVSQG